MKVKLKAQKPPRSVFHVQLGPVEWTPSASQLKALKKIFKKVMKKHGDVVVTSANVHVQQIA